MDRIVGFVWFHSSSIIQCGGLRDVWSISFDAQSDAMRRFLAFRSTYRISGERISTLVESFGVSSARKMSRSNQNMAQFYSRALRKHSMRNWQWLQPKVWRRNHEISTKNVLQNGGDECWCHSVWRSWFIMGVILFSILTHAVSDVLIPLNSANANTGRAAFWLLYETLRSRTLLHRAREAMRASIALQSTETLTQQPSIITSNASLPFDFPIFSSAPLIQSMYAETLRLRFAGIILRDVKDDVTLGDCSVPQKTAIAISTYHAHRNQESWNANTTKKPHSLDEFWAERFLVYPGNSNTPLKSSSKNNNDATPSNMKNETITSSPSSIPVAAKLNENSKASPQFSTKGLAGAWIPYGGGQNMCPGRHFAKQEVLVTFASILTSFDVQLIDDLPPKVDWSGFGLGMLAPAGKGIRFRIKRRRHLWWRLVSALLVTFLLLLLLFTNST